ncbi:hypothetical protein BJ912DRAFT_927579 [Pholiota molesta]|nr:hypothetical protein BJ912DRAFT_927579 [Pholiota molesta]
MLKRGERFSLEYPSNAKLSKGPPELFRPRRGTSSIALIRKRATVRPPLYRGPILINPGGPGESGVDIVRIAGRLFGTIVGPQFDIVGFDPRESVAAHGRVSFLGRLTAENDDGYLRHINTDQTARDMLRIVEAHGRTKLQYWGFSYGTVLGATFAAMFPDKVERIILDGVVDAENYYAYDIQKNLTALYDTVRIHPKPVRTKSGYGIVDYKMLHSAVFGSLYMPYASFPELAQGLAALAAGDGSLIFDMMNPPPFECRVALLSCLLRGSTMELRLYIATMAMRSRLILNRCKNMST